MMDWCLLNLRGDTWVIVGGLLFISAIAPALVAFALYHKRVI